jgi:hypothetical protein
MLMACTPHAEPHHAVRPVLACESLLRIPQWAFDRSPGAHGGCENGDQQEQNNDADADPEAVRV